MGTLLLSSMSVSLGFVFGVYWVKSGEELVVSRQEYNRIIIAAATWWSTAYSVIKKSLPNKEIVPPTEESKNI